MFSNLVHALPGTGKTNVRRKDAKDLSKKNRNRNNANKGASAEPTTPNEGFVADLDAYAEGVEAQAEADHTQEEEPVMEEAAPEEVKAEDPAPEEVKAEGPAPEEAPQESESERILNEEPAGDFSEECIIMGASTPEEKK